MRRVAGYVTVSATAGREGASFQSPSQQEDAIRAHCKVRRLDLLEVVHELDASGGTMERPRLQRLIAEVEAGKLAGIVVFRLDRFARTLVGGIQALEQIHEAGGFVQTVEGGIDTSARGGAMGELQLNLLLSLAQWERSLKAEGFEAAKQRAVARGVHIAGTVPVGYRKPARGARLDLDPVKADGVRAAFEFYAAGGTIAATARLLDEQLPGGPSGRGVWNKGTVRRLLKNRAYRGEARQGQFHNPDAHPEIVSQELFDTAQALLGQPEPPAVRAEIKNLLSGLCRCGACGYALEPHRVNKHYRAYRCRGHSAAGICDAPAMAMRDKLDGFVEEQVLERLAGYAVEQVAAADDVSELHGRIATARAKRAPFEDPDYVSALGVDAARRALLKVDDEIAALEQELADTVRASGAPTFEPQKVTELWPTLTTAERREVIAAMVDAVIVSRAPRGTPLADRVRVLWVGEQAPVVRPSRGRRKRPEVEAAMAAA